VAVTDILISPVNIWRSATGVALPDETSIAYGAAWGVGWTNLGYTAAPLSMKYDISLFELEVEQIASPIKGQKTKESLSFETQLSELTAANLLLAIGSTSTITTTAAGASQHAYEEVNAGGEPYLPEYQFGFEGYTLDASNRQLPCRLFVYRCTFSMSGSLEFSKKAAATIPLKIAAWADTSKTIGQQLFKLQRVTGWKTS
jgi:hypothetical protein